MSSGWAIGCTPRRVHLLQLIDELDDPGELGDVIGSFLLAHREAREVCDVIHVPPGQSHGKSLPDQPLTRARMIHPQL